MSAVEISAWAIALVALIPLSLALLNLWTWPRGRAEGRFDRPVSVLLPARNEERNIERCVRAIAASEHPVEEIIVLDDGSTDETLEIVRRLEAEIPSLRVISGRPLSPGWVGKPHACHQLGQIASGDIFLYIDADVALEPGGLGRLASLFVDHRANIVTMVPKQIVGGFTERLILPLLHLTYVSWFPLALVWRSKDPRFLAANGQLLAIDRQSYEAIGGFESVAREVVDDMALCRLAKQQGQRVVFADGHHAARCRMYQNAREVWAGFSKNLFEGLGAKTSSLAVVIALYALAFVVPYPLLGVALMQSGDWLVPAALAVAANVALRTLLAWRHAQPIEGIVLHPLSVLALLAIAINSRAWSRAGRIEWRGRVYAGRSTRASASVEEPRA